MRKNFLPLLVMAFVTLASFETKAQTGVDAYVSSSGYVIYHAPSIYAENAYVWDFEQDYVEDRLLEWTLLDADGDGHNWQLPMEGGLGHLGSDGVLFSYSYDNYSSAPLTPNNFMVSPRVTIPEGGVINFWACALDESYAAEHFAVAVSTTVNNNPSAFTVLQEWTLSAKSPNGGNPRGARGNRQGNWHQYTVDLSDYAGQDVYLAIRHFNTTDQFCLCVDDVFVGTEEAVALVGCDIILDGQTVASNQRGMRFMLNTNGFVDDSNHTTTVRAHYEGGLVVEKTCDWTYRTADHFQGSDSGLSAESDGNMVNLSWTLPTMSEPFIVDELFYDFADSTFSDLTLIDANHDGLNFRVYPYGGYGGGNCLKSDSWVSGGVGNVTPDNYVVSPRVTATESAQISFLAVDCDMPGLVTDKEHFGVAVSTASNNNPNDFTMLAEWNSTGSYTQYTVDLSAYAGQQIYVAIRHFNTDGNVYFLYVDNIHLTGIEAEVTRQAKGALVFANDELIATLDHGETNYTHLVNRYTSEYCIRIIQDGSRETGNYYALAAPQCADAELECIAPKNLAAEYDGDKVVLTWEREIYTGFEEDPDGWTFIDADEDGFVFGIYAAGGMNPDGSVNNTGTNPALVSFSYINEYGSLMPNNYAFMPKIKVLPNASITFYAAGFDPSYSAEQFAVSVASSDGMEIVDLAHWTSSNPYARYSVDLSEYAGQEIFLGFHHYSTVANYALCIDNITVTNVVWAGTESETVHYHINRSTNGTDYELIGYADGDEVSYEDNDMSASTYYYQVTAINTIAGGTCESEPAMAADGIHNYVVVGTDGLAENEDGINVYPNPAHDRITVEAEGLDHITILNALGQVVFDAVVDSETEIVDLSQFESGLYVLRVSTSNGIGVRQISVVK